MLGLAIKARLTAAQTGDDATQTSALATLTSRLAGRIYPGVSDVNVYPLVTYQVHQENEDAIQPMVAKEFTVTLTFSARGPGAYGVAHEIKAAARLLLDRKNSRTATDGAWGGIRVGKFCLHESDESNIAESGNPDSLFYEIVDEYRAWAEA